MARNLYVVIVRWVKTPQTTQNIERIDAVLTTHGDWLRFSGSNWLLDTDSSANQVFQSLASVLHRDDSELIVRADPHDYSGWSAKWVDDWVRGKQNQQAKRNQ